MNEDEETQLLMELFRPENRRPIAPELIQKFIKLDPQRYFLKFWEWLINAKDEEETVRILNDIPAYRFYLTTGVKLQLEQVNYSKLSAEALYYYIGIGAQNFRILKRYCDWEDIKYPQEPLPARFIDEQIIKLCSPIPLTGYFFVIFSIYLWWYYALLEIIERAKDHPELAGFLSYHTATDEEIKDLSQELAPKGYQFPNQNEAWIKLEQSMKKRLEAKARKYGDVYPLESVQDDVLTESYVTAQGSLLGGVNYWKSKAHEAVVAGLRGQLGNSLLSVVEHDFVDAAGKAYRKHEVTESKIEATRVRDEGDNTPFLDTIPSLGSEALTEEKHVTLESLGLDIDKLTPTELLVVKDVLQGFKEGYEFDSKWGKSFKERWGNKDYQKNIKTWNRAKTKLTKR